MTTKSLPSQRLITLDNQLLLNCYSSTGYLTEYLDSIQSKLDRVYIWDMIVNLPSTTKPFSTITPALYTLLLVRHSKPLHGAMLYLLLWLDKDRYAKQMLEQQGIILDTKEMLGISSKNKLCQRLRSRPDIGRRHAQGGYPRSKSG